MGEWHTDRNAARADSKEPAKGFREVVAHPDAALIIPTERSGQELTATVSLVTTHPCHEAGISTSSPAHPKLEVTREWAAQRPGRNSTATSPKPRSRGDLVLCGEGWNGALGFPAFRQLCKTSSLLTSQLSLGKDIPCKALASMG